MAKTEVIEESDPGIEDSGKKTEKPKEQVKSKGKTSWKKIGIGLGIVVIGNLYSFLTAYSKGIFFNTNTVIGLLAIIVGLYIILK